MKNGRTYRVTVDDGVELPVPGERETWTVGAVILNERGEAFAQKRSGTRRLFPRLLGHNWSTGGFFEGLIGASFYFSWQETRWAPTSATRDVGPFS